MATITPTVPAGMIEVSKVEFYRRLYADQRDIMPVLTFPEHTRWETRNRVLWGWSFPGWRNPSEPTIYAVKV